MNPLDFFLHKMWVQLLIGMVTFISLIPPPPFCVLLKVFSGKSSVCHLIVACCTIPVVGGVRARGKGYSLSVASCVWALLCGVLVDHFASVHCWGSWAFPGALLLFNIMQWRLFVHANCNMQTYQYINIHYFWLHSLRVVRFMVDILYLSSAFWILI